MVIKPFARAEIANGTCIVHIMGEGEGGKKFPYRPDKTGGGILLRPAQIRRQKEKAGGGGNEGQQHSCGFLSLERERERVWPCSAIITQQHQQQWPLIPQRAGERQGQRNDDDYDGRGPMGMCNVAHVC